jgi:superfamily II DNA helicase RecQ
MVLSTPLSSRAVKTDAVVAAFTRNAENNLPSRQQLEAAQVSYQQRLILACFDFHGLRSSLNRFARLLLQYSQVIQLPGKCDVQETAAKTMAEIIAVGENFQNQLEGFFSGNRLPESDPHIRERITKASSYFQEKINRNLMDFFAVFKIETDNKEIQKNIRDALEKLQKETAVKLAAVQSCQAGFSSGRYLRAISAAEIDFKPVRKRKARAVEYTQEDVGHPELFQELREWRSEQAADADVPHYRILHQKVLIQIAISLPETLPDLMKIKGIGKRLAEKYGQELVEMVSEYRERHGIT